MDRPPIVVNAYPSELLNNNIEMSWWGCRFKIIWPKESMPQWPVDLLLAHRVIEPVLREYSNKIVFWRFHRRAGYDESGHQFSFLFYSSSDNSKLIMARVKENEILQSMLNEKIIEKIIFDDPEKPQYPRIDAMSDSHWSPLVQKNWPSFIMGVCSLWLGLIDDIIEESSISSHDLGPLLEQYEKAEDEISKLWRKEGQHAFFHHLSAIFGYEPLIIIRKIQF